MTDETDKTPESMSERERMTEEDSTANSIPVTRRGALAALAGLGLGLGAKEGAETATADSVGRLGTSADPLSAAYLDGLRGPIVDRGDEITQLVDSRIEEKGANISVQPNTLVFRYDPNTTV